MGKTVTTYLINGDPKGTRYVFIGSDIFRMYVIPRTKLEILNEEKYLKFSRPALYILLGENEDTKPKAYIGQTENFRERVKTHDNKKDFWNKVLLFISTSDAALTSSSIKYLEYCAIRDAKKTDNYVLNENKQVPKEPILPEHQKAPIDDFYQDVKFLTSFYGCTIFDNTGSSKVKLFYTKGRGCDAKGIYNDEGFTVLKSSILAETTVPSFKWASKREKLLSNFAQKRPDGKYILLADKTFSSPSTAADFCIGSCNNGWLLWKDKDGNTLDSVIRKHLKI
ncbi:MAG: GIY-YIG nuclease family protein [Bacteroidales bacterium]|nr:GIY-YIG nuclease family protein [Bacteroidales bacterium]